MEKETSKPSEGTQPPQPQEMGDKAPKEPAPSEKKGAPTNFDNIVFTHKTEQHDKKLAAKQVVRIAIVGNVDSGKSTLCSVLTKGIMDDGRGSARVRVFNYPHEASNGRTSSVGQEIMGWDDKGVQQFAERFVQNKNKYWAEVVSKSSKFVSLIDLCGHEKYLKTTMLGMVGLVPDYAMIIVGANMGISKMTKEHLGISLAIKLPFFVVMTKVDMVEKVVADKTIEELKALLKTNAVNRKPVVVSSDKEMEVCAEAIVSDRICPIFAISSVSGENVERLTKFIYNLRTRNMFNEMIGSIDDPVEFDIHERFTVTGVGLVVSGTLRSGTIKIGQVLLCGPDKFKKFRAVTVKSIHVNRVPEEEAYAGSFCCFSIKALNKKEELNKADFRKGMCLLAPELDPVPVWRFEAEVIVLHHATTIKEGYQAVMHCGVVRQTVCIEKMNKEVLRAKDSDVLAFRFMYHPEFIKKDSRIILREGRTKILGVITKVIRPNAEELAQMSTAQQQPQPNPQPQPTEGVMEDKPEHSHK
jgi:GTPase